MALVFGVSPSRKGSLGFCALYWQARLPASLIQIGPAATVDETRARLVGLVGEWGELAAVAVASPLTWSGTSRGVRAVDVLLRRRLPAWAPKTWVRSPLTLPSPVAIQGPALAWWLADEIRHNQLPRHALVESQPRVSLVQLWPDRQVAVLGYAAPKATETVRRRHIAELFAAFVDAGIVRPEVDGPQTPVDLEALVSALTALGVAAPESGLVVHELRGGEIRPIGRRPVVVLAGLP